MIEIKNLLISNNGSIHDAIVAIDKGAIKIAFVINELGKCIGTVSDGDIRRSLLKGATLNSPVISVMNPSFHSIPDSSSEHEAIVLMKDACVSQIPALDKDGCISKVFLLDELLRSDSRLNSVVIMAGGRGQRLSPLTDNCPKPMLSVGGKPILERVIESCIAYGFRNFYISVNYLKNQIQEYFGSGAPWGISIKYLEEDKALGTAGALSLLTENQGSPLLVMNGDVLSDVNLDQLMEFHEQSKASLTLCVRDFSMQIPYGVVRLDGSKLMHIEEKPFISNFISAGVYVVDPAALRILEKDRYCDMPNFIDELRQTTDNIYAFPVHEFWADVGHQEILSSVRVKFK